MGNLSYTVVFSAMRISLLGDNRDSGEGNINMERGVRGREKGVNYSLELFMDSALDPVSL